MAQMWKGEQYLFFWAGEDSVGGHGAGHYYMVSQACASVIDPLNCDV